MRIKYPLALILSCTIQLVWSQFTSNKIDSLGEITLGKTNTSGAFISIMRSDTVIYQSAFGINDAGTGSTINDSTIFPISSNTKAFNALLLAYEAQQERIDFDSPLKQYLPELELKSEFITKELTLTDLLTHRWGIPRYDLTYFGLPKNESNPNEAVFKKLKYLETSTSFRTAFQYGNNQYILGAYLLEQLNQQKWEVQLQNHILNPLKMTDTHCDLDKYLKSPNKSFGYQQTEKVSMDLVKSLYRVSGMGNMFSSIRDLQKWCTFLQKGDSTILNPDWIEYTQTGHFLVGYEEPYPGFSNISYGFGWYVYDYYGTKVVLHHGDNIGHQTLIVLLPDDDISFIMVANEGMVINSFCFNMMLYLMDMYNEKPLSDWNNLRRATPSINYEAMTQAQNLYKIKNKKKYTGVYHHEGFGDIHIFLEKGALFFGIGDMKHPLNPKNQKHFTTYYKEYGEEYRFEFEWNEKGEIINLKTDLIEPSIAPILFMKMK